MYLKLIIFLLLIAGSHLPLLGQMSLKDTTIYINEVMVESSRLLDFSTGSTIQSFDSTTLSRYGNQSLGDLMRWQSTADIRMYGPGGLASSSIRGGGSSHTLVLWNGLSLKSPTNGGTNLSNLVANMYDRVDVQYGGSGTLYGSGAVTGIIHLSSNDVIKQPDNINLKAGAGSYDNYNLFASWKTGSERIASRLKVYGSQADNDFEYKNRAKFGNPVERQTNGGHEQYGIMHDLETKIGDRSTLSTSIWYHFNDKDIQTLMTDSDTSRANQTDKDWRVSANWVYRGNDFLLKFNNGFLTNSNTYTNESTPGLPSVNEFWKYINEIDYQWFPNAAYEVNLGLNHTAEYGKTINYTDNPQRRRVSLYGSFKVTEIMGRLTFTANAREEYVDDEFIPFVYSTGFELKTWPGIILFGSYSKNYQLPTFNDLYWKADAYAGGNPDLIPEDGHSAEFGIDTRETTGAFDWHFRQNAYYTHINNWIVWLPDASGAWTPTNKQTGKTYGLESRINVEYEAGRWNVINRFHYTLTRARMKDNAESPESTAFYIPQHKFMWDMGINYQKYSLNYTHNYYSKRYYDRSNALAPYQIGNLRIAVNQPFNVQEINVACTVNNIWNKEYQIMAWYAMPLRTYELSLTYNFKY